MCWPNREQAHSYRGFLVDTDFVFNTDHPVGASLLAMAPWSRTQASGTPFSHADQFFRMSCTSGLPVR